MQVVEKNKIEKISPVKKKKQGFIMPTKENYVEVLAQNYTIKQLKEILDHYKIKINGATIKADLLAKIVEFFKLYDMAVIIQKAWRHHLCKQYARLRGPARFKRHLCVNDTDFFTMDDLQDIPYKQFYSFMDTDKMIYGFDIMSIYTLLYKGMASGAATANGAASGSASGAVVASNPYNRNIFPKEVTENIKKITRLSNIFKDLINLDMNEGEEEKKTAINFETRLMTLFCDIDHLGNYTNYNWVLNLNTSQLIRFIMSLHDIWVYRANLPELVKREICPEHRELFHYMHMIDLRIANIIVLREVALDIMNKLVRDGINTNAKSLGTNLVLCALTLVSSDAAEAMPWFYESVI
jgi:hypothetical protein